MKLRRISKFSESRNCYKSCSGTKKTHKDEIYQDIPVNSLKGLGKTYMEKLNAVKIMICGQLCDLPKDRLDVDGVSKKEVLEFKECAQNTVKVSNRR